ncbi:MAG TPA: L-2-hydroxyglutarate oxidase [Streptosporangiaceae bacterium]
MTRVGVIGAGIVGLAVARELGLRLPGAEITVVDKEDRVAAHQTGHNSGVVHAGLYYTPGSLKARLCRRGMGLLRDYCTDHGLPYNECGKLVVAATADEVPGLREIERKATENAVPDLTWLNAAALREIEPHAEGVAALHSPHTAITDFTRVAQAFAADVMRAGGRVRLGMEVTQVSTRGDRVRIGCVTRDATGGAEGVAREVADGPGSAARDAAGGQVTVLEFDRLVVCGGLHADRLGRLAGDTAGPAIVPFRGEYYRLRAERDDLVRGLIYPVPDPRYPFLGVHFTRRVGGGVDIGPNAVTALSREGYRWGDIRARDLWETLTWPGSRRLAARHWRAGVREMYGSLVKAAFIAQARRYVPELTPGDVVAAPAGVRAQAVDADGSLVDDFRINRRGPVTVVRNAPSPAATSSMAIAEHIADQVLDP